MIPPRKEERMPLFSLLLGFLAVFSTCPLADAHLASLNSPCCLQPVAEAGCGRDCRGQDRTGPGQQPLCRATPAAAACTEVTPVTASADPQSANMLPVRL